MSTNSPLAIPDPVEEANRRFLDARRNLAPAIIAGDPGLQTAHRLQKITDRWLCQLWDHALADQFQDTVSLYATGGYGRDELCYHSDIDVLIALHDAALTDDADFALAMERLMAWSRHTRVCLSQAVRTTDQVRQLALDDLHTAIALLDLRYLSGPPGIDEEFGRADVIEVLRNHDGGRSFVLALIDEYRRRIARNGKTVFLLEPDVKNGEGGLRDLNNIGWAARVRWQLDVRRATDHSVSWGDAEQSNYCRRLDELLALRNQLHLLRDRKHDRLTFREQEALARLDESAAPDDADDAFEAAKHALTLAESPRDDDPKRRALAASIEAKMAIYYRRARAISTHCERALRRWSNDSDTTGIRRGPFEIRGGQLSLAEDSHLTDDEVFEALVVAGERDLLLDPRLETALEQKVAQWPAGDDAPSPLAHRLGKLLVDPRAPRRTSRRLLELGALTRIVPEFGPLVCHVHHDLYHVYTTDIHSLKCLEEGRRLLGADTDEHRRPAFCHIAHQVDDRSCFLMACLFHDIGKNRGGGHSEKGARLMESVAPRLGLDAERTERVVFLVRHHLDLSNTSRRRDVSDPEIIDGLARPIGDLETLNQLTALTYCDMSTVGPEVMDDWNASLLLQLYRRLYAALSPPESATATDASSDASERRARRRRILAEQLDDQDFDGAALDAFVDDLPLDHLLETEIQALDRQFETYHRTVWGDEDLAISLMPLSDRAATEIIVSCPDRPGTLAQITGAIASCGVNIMAANIVSTAGGHTLDIFHVAHFNPRAVPPVQPHPVDAPRRLQRLEERIAGALRGEIDVASLLEQRRGEQRLAPRPVPAVSTEINVDTDASSRFTILEVRAPDRRGLLYTIARTLLDCEVDIRVSRIDSLGHQAIDTFYVEEWNGDPLSSKRIDEVVCELRRAVSHFTGGGE